MNIIENDVQLLDNLNLLDYSLLLGVEKLDIKKGKNNEMSL